MNEIVLIIIGITFGFILGLIPGMHSNTVISIFIASGLISKEAGIIAISMISAHILASFLLSMFFGAGNQDNAAATLPTQKMIRKGLGKYATTVLILSFCLSIIMATATLYPISIVYSQLKDQIIRYVKYIIPIITVLIIARTKNPVNSALIFTCAGIFGIFTFQLKMQDPFLPMFSGMFAMPLLIGKYKRKRTKENVSISGIKSIPLYTAIGTVLGAIADVLPGVSSPSQMAILAGYIMHIPTDAFLSMIVSITVSQYILSISTLSALSKARIGSIHMLASNFIIDLNTITQIFVISSLISGIIFYLIKDKLIAYIDRLKKLNIYVAFLLILTSVAINGVLGIVVLAFGFLIGDIANKTDTERVNLMGSIIMPTILWYATH